MVTLADPLKVRNFTLRNRIVMPRVNTDYATEKGRVTDKLIQHYMRRSKDLGLLTSVQEQQVKLRQQFSVVARARRHAISTSLANCIPKVSIKML